MHMYTNKWLHSVLASLAPFKERFRATAGCNTKNAYGIEPRSTRFNRNQNLCQRGLKLYYGREATVTASPGILC